jgi:hypothetical protein
MTEERAWATWSTRAHLHATDAVTEVAWAIVGEWALYTPDEAKLSALIAQLHSALATRPATKQAEAKDGPSNMSREVVERIRETAQRTRASIERNPAAIPYVAIDPEELLCLCDAALAPSTHEQREG